MSNYIPIDIPLACLCILWAPGKTNDGSHNICITYKPFASEDFIITFCPVTSFFF